MGRAIPLPPEQRRQAIIEAARPLLIESPGQFTTKQVARAAGIAEGTIFRVFDSKQDLVRAVIADALDPTELCDQLRSLPPSTSLVDHVAALIELFRARHDTITAVAAAVHTCPDQSGPGHSGPDMSVYAQRVAMARDAIAASLTSWQDELRLPPADAAAIIETLARGSSHPLLDSPLPDPDVLARAIVHGIDKD